MFSLKNELEEQGWLERQIGWKAVKTSTLKQPAVAESGRTQSAEKLHPKTSPYSPSLLFLREVIDDLPVSLDDIEESKILNDHDLWLIAKGEIGVEALRLYIGSWLLAEGQFPFVLHADWKERLQDRGQI
jgi:hypothetical protein